MAIIPPRRLNSSCSTSLKLNTPLEEPSRSCARYGGKIPVSLEAWDYTRKVLQASRENCLFRPRDPGTGQRKTTKRAAERMRNTRKISPTSIKDSDEPQPR